jgi:hypothetical protein
MVGAVYILVKCQMSAESSSTDIDDEDTLVGARQRILLVLPRAFVTG